MVMPSELDLPSQLVSAAPEQRLFFFLVQENHRGSLFPLHALAQVCGVSQSLITDVAKTFWPHFCSCWVQKPAWKLQSSIFSLNSTATAIFQLRKKKALKCGALLVWSSVPKFFKTLETFGNLGSPALCLWAFHPKMWQLWAWSCFPGCSFLFYA